MAASAPNLSPSFPPTKWSKKLSRTHTLTLSQIQFLPITKTHTRSYCAPGNPPLSVYYLHILPSYLPLVPAFLSKIMAFCITFGTHEFTNQLEGYEGVTAQCHNCEFLLFFFFNCRVWGRAIRGDEWGRG